MHRAGAPNADIRAARRRMQAETERAESKMDLTDLMSSRDEAPPSGENLEYDMDFINLGMAAEPGEERQEGSTIHPAEDPDWARREGKGAGACWPAATICAPPAFSPRPRSTPTAFPALPRSPAISAPCSRNTGTTVHPILDPDDNDDPTARINAVQTLAGRRHDAAAAALRAADRKAATSATSACANCNMPRARCRRPRVSTRPTAARSPRRSRIPRPPACGQSGRGRRGAWPMSAPSTRPSASISPARARRSTHW